MISFLARSFLQTAQLASRRLICSSGLEPQSSKKKKKKSLFLRNPLPTFNLHFSVSDLTSVWEGQHQTALVVSGYRRGRAPCRASPLPSWPAVLPATAQSHPPPPGISLTPLPPCFLPPKRPPATHSRSLTVPDALFLRNSIGDRSVTVGWRVLSVFKTLERPFRILMKRLT